MKKLTWLTPDGNESPYEVAERSGHGRSEVDGMITHKKLLLDVDNILLSSGLRYAHHPLCHERVQAQHGHRRAIPPSHERHGPWLVAPLVFIYADHCSLCLQSPRIPCRTRRR